MSARANVAQSHPFTCNTCQVAFRSSELQRGHMHSDWHRYNLKRRVASLPPLASEAFAEKVLSAQASTTAAAAKAAFEKSCDACQKTYYSENAYANHLGSQKHRANASALKNRPATNKQDDETQSVMSSTFSLGEPVEVGSTIEETPAAEKEFSNVVDSLKNATINDKEPISRRPTRPHHSSQDARPEHPLSQTTTETEKADNEDEDADGEETEESVPLSKCLFCNLESPSLDVNVTHMSKNHGMFIPERPFLVDLAGLVSYLYEKIADLHECLYCGKFKSTAEGVQTHMRDKGHCMIAYSTEQEMLEIGQFYDFRGTYSDEESEEDSESYDSEEEDEEWESADEDEEDEDLARSPGGGVKLGAKRDAHTKTMLTTEDGAEQEVASGAEEGEGWETDSDASSVASDEITAIPVDVYPRREKLVKHRHHSHHDPRPHRNADGWHSRAHTTPRAVYHDDFELHLPSGRTAGHRSLAKYYRQNLRNYPTPEERANQQAIAEDAHVSSDDERGAGIDGEGRGRELQQRGGRDRGRQIISRANGGTGMLGVTDGKKKEVSATEKRETKRGQRAQARYQWGVEKRGNHQKHFRDPLLQ
ncbi:hypothetical protein L228DRAFT_248930 [Xylona heveae TC161]|uniref:C2H2-type domain-containing protein n=1 Tax=Xylona heveae (strain CBS 132557 / TC161) TaxID=1328760 RepID=A0A165FMJ0_XYLHT|nr:hypothetical protein L228DRAFT_248930 [Xylona heveae TC161]KZF21158.1 hypothetical protein L228DRAFT_248930 [Xylona heveae TC161]